MIYLLALSLLIPSAAFAAPECPQSKTLSDYRAKSGILNDQNKQGIKTFEEKFAKLCAIGTSYSCKSGMMSSQEFEAFKKAPVGRCDMHLYIHLENQTMNVYSMLLK